MAPKSASTASTMASSSAADSTDARYALARRPSPSTAATVSAAASSFPAVVHRHVETVPARRARARAGPPDTPAPTADERHSPHGPVPDAGVRPQDGTWGRGTRRRCR